MGANEGKFLSKHGVGSLSAFEEEERYTKGDGNLCYIVHILIVSSLTNYLVNYEAVKIYI